MIPSASSSAEIHNIYRRKSWLYGRVFDAILNLIDQEVEVWGKSNICMRNMASLEKHCPGG